jgi:hypothetical protein
MPVLDPVNASSPLVLSRTSPTQISHLEPGELYQISGTGETVGMLPVQIFRFESLSNTWASGTVLLIGTLYWKVWVGNRWFSGKFDNHMMAIHHVSIGVGSRLSSQHDFHLEKIELADVPKILGKGKIYLDFLKDEESS